MGRGGLTVSASVAAWIELLLPRHSLNRRSGGRRAALDVSRVRTAAIAAAASAGRCGCDGVGRSWVRRRRIWFVGAIYLARGDERDERLGLFGDCERMTIAPARPWRGALAA
jgi:hypothetical protein